ncbi:3-oxoacyl-ACP reductase [Bacillus sp. FJAT-29790]|uniref:3-oxoacyl-ACP reductase n=1 Tax=Bacillus sp. FJAT-29790 TaxID=1895002 RepID=UPI001C232CF8|nr:3-oxoacyl-ACP reductase [Bacillus sp. FJAT-29790]MBU8881227.1 3-oxoacyl-ACP reductase [Bacillus sp. FJAT-29790]
MANLHGKIAIVTGGAVGIGAAISKELAQNGVKVVLNYNSSSQAAEKLVSSINENGGTALAVQADVSIAEEAAKLVNAAIDTYGQLDILVNNAGITRDRSFKKLSEDDWRKVIDVNLNSVYNTVSPALNYISQSDAGRIINISSIIGQTGAFGQTNYAAAKAGMIGFTKSLALELARTSVTVNAICPGFIETSMVTEIPEDIRQQIQAKVPKKRFGHPEEIAKGVLYLCKDGAYITGQQLNINGGLFM